MKKPLETVQPDAIVARLNELDAEKLDDNSNLKLDKIVDNQGNPRFIEGDIDFEEVAGLTKTYGKWSLSGTHLMIVIAGTIADATTISASADYCFVNLPEWIKNKIIPVTANFVDIKNTRIYSPDYATGQDVSYRLYKGSTNYLSIRAPITTTAERNFRFAFDLLIDTEAPEDNS